ncbi:MAG TPA: STAS domain-containing protein [Isosphaeraceae bacterium]|jgi:anti-sigma B factor antagonist|nr:STAS domain-containing protein [Isosphaeraceae bacterium]
MALNIRVDGSVAILSNFARLMNDPRYVDAARDVHDRLDQGIRNYVIELAGVKETGSSFLGVLMTITREIRSAGGEAVLAHPSRDVEKYLAMMQLDDYWDVFGTVDEAKGFFQRNGAHQEDR